METLARASQSNWLLCFDWWAAWTNYTYHQYGSAFQTILQSDYSSSRLVYNQTVLNQTVLQSGIVYYIYNYVDIVANQFTYETDGEDFIREESSDSYSSVHEIYLYYSKEDVHSLAVKAEQMVLQSSCHKNYSKAARASWQDSNAGESSDSDYESKISRECFISSEPNISQRRLSPNRKSLNFRREDWQKSLPECLQYFSLGVQSFSPLSL